jgi:hypothetical protein
MFKSLRPKPFRGDQVAAGVVVLTTLVWFLQVRFGTTWPSGARLAFSVVAFAAVFAMAVQAPLEFAAPRAYQSILYLASAALALSTLVALAGALGANGGSPATVTAMAALVTGLLAWFATARRSAASLFVATVTGGVGLIALAEWIGNPGAGTIRLLLLALVIVYGLTAVAQRDRRPRHGVALVNGAGLASLAIGVTLALELDGLGDGMLGLGNGIGTGWELLLLGVGFGLVAYAAVDREPGPAYLGVANLVGFILLAAAPSHGGASLVGWPIVLGVGAAALLAIGLRPSIPAPPPPDADEPPAPTAPLRR